MKTTVICALWHRDPKMWSLIDGHRENLDKQSVDHRRIYIIDGTPHIEWKRTIDGLVIVVGKPLTIYQAWNAALSIVDTEYVMNLNLDDRLYPDAIELMEDTLDKEKSFLVGGDWRLCHSQDETDDIFRECGELEYPVCETWPPKIQARERLGSGDGTRGTFGPSTMWRMDSHRYAECYRYPWRFHDGSLIKSAGDAAWWGIMAHRGMKLSRLPLMIGNYHSHAGEQAEFREDARDEMKKLGVVGVRID